jgi:hypothetical protein
MYNFQKQEIASVTRDRRLFEKTVLSMVLPRLPLSSITDQPVARQRTAGPTTTRKLRWEVHFVRRFYFAWNSSKAPYRVNTQEKEAVQSKRALLQKERRKFIPGKQGGKELCCKFSFLSFLVHLQFVSTIIWWSNCAIPKTNSQKFHPSGEGKTTNSSAFLVGFFFDRSKTRRLISRWQSFFLSHFPIQNDISDQQAK